MADIYLYNANETDCTTIGIVGALQPQEATFTEIANGMSSIKIVHPKDEYGRYKELKQNRIIKCSVPVRSTPEIQNGNFVRSVQIFKLKNGMTKDDRTIWSKKEKGKKLKVANDGDTVTVVEAPSDGRWKVKYTSTVTKHRKTTTSTITGWIERNSLNSTAESTVNLPDGANNLESVAPSWTMQEQLFRIYSVEKNEDTVTVEAQHISYDLMYNLIAFDEDGEMQLQGALDAILTYCIDPHDFTAKTNITGGRVGIHWENKDPITAILDPDEGFISRWNGELIRDNYELYILDTAGMNRGVRFQYGKNVTGIEMKLDMSNVATGIRPIGQTNDGKPLTLTQSYVLNENGTWSEVAGDRRGILFTSRKSAIDNGTDTLFAHHRIYALDGEDCKAGEYKKKSKQEEPTDEQVRARLLEQGKKAVEDGCENPDISIDVDMALLSTSEQYADYRELERVFLFDTVTVAYPEMGILEQASVSEIEWDLIEDRLKNIKLGTLNDLVSSVSSWQIKSVSGSKLISGTVNSDALVDGAISARHIQAQSVNAEAILAGSITADEISSYAITADKLRAGAVTADKISAGAVTADKISAKTITAEKINTDSFKAAEANIGEAIIGQARIDFAKVNFLEADTGKFEQLITKNQTGDRVFINKLQVNNAQLVSATVGSLVLKSKNEKGETAYYRLEVTQDENGNDVIRPVNVTVTQSEINAGQTSDGTRSIIETDLTVTDLGATNIKAIDALISHITADRIDALEIYAHKGEFDEVKTKVLGYDSTLEIMSKDVEDSLKRAGNAETAATNAQTSASTAKDKADQAASSASSASSSASAAQQSATAAQQSAQSSVTSTVIHYLATSASTDVTRSTKGWTPTIQTIDSTKRYLWTYIDYIKQSGGIATSTDPVISGVYGQTGVKGDKGDSIKGDKGDTGTSVTKVQPQYYLSTSSSSATGGSWSNTPTWSDGKYIWTRTHCTYSDGSTSDSTAVYDSALTDAVKNATNAQNAIDSLEIGGVNLIPHSGTMPIAYQVSKSEWYKVNDEQLVSTKGDDGYNFVTFPNVSDNASVYVSVNTGISLSDLRNHDITVSFEARVSSLASVDSYLRVHLSLFENTQLAAQVALRTKQIYNSAYVDTLTKAVRPALTTQWRRFSYTVKNVTEASFTNDPQTGKTLSDSNLFALYFFPINANGCQIRHVQMEYGNRVTGWKPSNSEILSSFDALSKELQDTQDGLITTYYSNTTPSDPAEGDIWYNTDGVIKRYNGSGWDEIKNAQLKTALDTANTAKATADGKINTYTSATAPTGVSEGDLWIDTSNDNELKRYNATSKQWFSVRDGLISVAKQTADAANKAINDLNFGGVNLLSDVLVPYTRKNGVSMELEEDGWIHVIGTPTKSGGFALYSRTANGYTMPTWKAGTTYTMTVFFDGECWFPKGNKDISVCIGNMSGSDIWYDTKDYSYTFTPTSDVTIGDVVLYPREGALNRAINGRIKVQIEEGNKPTAWTPNIYDTLMRGGRNFLLNTGSLVDWYHPNVANSCFSGSYAMLPADSSRSGNNYIRDRSLKYSDIEDREIIVSFEAKAEKALTDEDFLLLRLHRGVTPAGSSTRNYTIPYIRGVFLTTEWKRYTRRFKVDDSSFTAYSGSDDEYCRPIFANGTTSNLHIRNIKMEIGRVASDFSVAPEDAVNDANKYTKGEIEKVEGSIGSLSEEVEKTKERLNALSIGGYNLIPNSDRMPISTTGKVWNVQQYYLEKVKIVSVDRYDGTSSVVFGDNAGDTLVWSNFTINSGYKLSELKGKTVIITFDAKAASNGTETGSTSYPQVAPTLFDSTIAYADTTSRTAATNNTYLRRIRDNAQTPALTSTWERFKIVLPEISLSMFTSSYNNKTKSENDLFGLTVFRYNMKGAEYRKFKMEIGDVPTEWSTQPSDVIHSDVNILSETMMGSLNGTTYKLFGVYDGDGWVHIKCTPSLTADQAIGLYTHLTGTSFCNATPTMKAGQQYCISVECEGDCWGSNMYVYSPDIPNTDGKFVASPSTTTRAGNNYYVVTPTADVSQFRLNVMFKAASNGVSVDGRVRVKVTEGNQYSTWTPHPLDTVVSGGENLLRETSNLVTWGKSNTPVSNFTGSAVMISHTTAASSNYWISSIPRTIPYEDIMGKEIVLSFDARCEDDPDGQNRLEARMVLSDTESGAYQKYAYFRLYRPFISNQWRRYYKCFKLTDDMLVDYSSTTNPLKYVGVMFHNFTISNMYIRNIKLEFGRAPTAYCRNDEDMIADYSEKIRDTIRTVGDNWDQYEEFRKQYQSYVTYDESGSMIMRGQSTTSDTESPWSTEIAYDGFYIRNKNVDEPIGKFYKDRFEPKTQQFGAVIVRSTGTGWAWMIGSDDDGT